MNHSQAYRQWKEKQAGFSRAPQATASEESQAYRQWKEQAQYQERSSVPRALSVPVATGSYTMPAKKTPVANVRNMDGVVHTSIIGSPMESKESRMRNMQQAMRPVRPFGVIQRDEMDKMQGKIVPNRSPFAG